MLTKPSPVNKGSANEFSLVKSELITLLTSLSAPSRYLDASNWSMVKLNYKSQDGIQRRTARLYSSGLNMVGDFMTSLKADNSFQIDSVEVIDFDNGSFFILRENLTTSEFDVTFGPAGTVKLTRNFSNAFDTGFTSEAFGGGVSRSGGLLHLIGNNAGTYYYFVEINKSSLDLGKQHVIRLYLNPTPTPTINTRLRIAQTTGVEVALTNEIIAQGYVDLPYIDLNSQFTTFYSYSANGVDNIELDVSKLEIVEL